MLKHATIITASLIAVLTLILILVNAPVAPAGEKRLCGPRPELSKMLSQTFGEKLAGRGISNTNGVIEIFVSRSRVWTLTSTRPNGIACIIFVGTGWENLAGVPA